LRLGHFDQLQPYCLACKTDDFHSPLMVSHVVRKVRDDILEGLLRCSNSACQYEYPVIDGIPFLLSNLPEFLAANAEVIRSRTDLSALTNSVLGDCCGPDSAFNITRQHLSSYGWCHYGDLDPQNSDADAGSTVGALRLMGAGTAPIEGPTIDLGCSVGRASFELAETSGQLTLGVDLNVAMLRMASDVLRHGRVCYPLRRVGVVYDERDFETSFEHPDKVDFWACDATMLPFADGTFSRCVSLNSLDSVPSPVGLLQSMGRITATGGTAQVACPYDWSSSVTAIQGWIGGHSQRAEHLGRSEQVLRQLLNEPSELSRQWQIISEQDDLPWIVRLHDRSKMSYRLHAVTLQRMAMPESLELLSKRVPAATSQRDTL
jgi:SAM-dependent methyltransferase/uncharacterized protein YbaR (Trm112 family)